MRKFQMGGAAPGTIANVGGIPTASQTQAMTDMQRQMASQYYQPQNPTAHIEKFQAGGLEDDDWGLGGWEEGISGDRMRAPAPAPAPKAMPGTEFLPKGIPGAASAPIRNAPGAMPGSQYLPTNIPGAANAPIRGEEPGPPSAQHTAGDWMLGPWEDEDPVGGETVPSGAHTTTTAANTPAAGGSQNADIKNSGIFSPEAQARIHARAQEQLRSDLASWHARDLASEAALRAAPSRPYRTTAPLYDTDTAATEAEPGQVNQQIPGLAAGWRAAQATTPGQQEIPGVAAGWRAAQAVSPQAQTNQAVQAGLRAAQATTPNIPAGLPPQLATQAQTAQNPGPFGGAVANWANQAGSNLMARANQIGANVPATGLPSQLTGQQAQLPNVGGAIGTGAQNLGGALSGLAWRAGNWAAGLGANVPTTGLAPQLAQQNAVQAGLQAAQATPPPQGVPAPPVLPSQQPGAMPGSQFLPGGIPGAAAPAAPRVTQPAITQPRVVTPPGATPTRQTLFAHMAQAEQQYGLPHGTLYGHAMAESNMNPNARRLGAGADKSYGLMQFTTPTAQQYGLTNPYDPHASIDAAAHFISDLRRQFGGDTNKAIMAYNTGAGNVRKGNIGPGTRAYLPKVLGFIDQAPYARGGAVKHDDARQDRQQMLGILKEKGLTKARGGRFAKGGASADDTPPKAIPGKSVLRRAPHGKIALPVMHIAIMAIPKHKGAEKHASGGTIEIPPERQERRARRPGAVPPVKGKTPRGVGKALRGWGRTGQ